MTSMWPGKCRPSLVLRQGHSGLHAELIRSELGAPVSWSYVGPSIASCAHGKNEEGPSTVATNVAHRWTFMTCR